MKPEIQHKLVWGWLRLVLGQIQIGCAGAAMYVLLTIGLHRAVWILISMASFATIVSRAIYKGCKYANK